MATHTGVEEHIELAAFRRVQQRRQRGEIGDDDRVVFFAPDEPVRLHTAFGHGADDAMFEGIVTANFRALNPGMAV
ncbi:MAG: hypothetical protein OXD31_17140 [Chloroflexi bacterium]|nr:hypothetical protein [Chloroflexota bacterium]